MKRILAIFACLSMAASADLGWHTFASGDGGKKFVGELIGFREDQGMVSVKRKDNLRIMSFKLSLLSAEDQAYVKENGASLAAASSLRLSFEKNRERLDDDKLRRSKGCYHIALKNFSTDTFEDVEVDYLVIHQRGGVNQAAKIEVEKGSKQFSVVVPNGEDYVTTAETTIQTSISRTKQACSGGG